MGTSTFPTRDELQSLIRDLQDASESYDDSITANGTATRGRLIGLAKDLINELRNPMDMADAHIANANELVAIRTCLHLKAFHAIPFPGSISLDEIADKTSASGALLERLLRMLVCTGFLQSPQAGYYGHTKHSYAYTLMPGPGMFFQLVYDESFLMIDNLHMYLSDKGYTEPVDQRYSPYAWKSRQEGTDIWEIMAQHPERLHAFQAGLAHADASIPLLGYYDFAQFSEDSSNRPTFVDIGGGAGHVIAQILQAYPQLDASKFVLQDLPAVVKKAGENKTLSKQVQIMQHNFFTEQPVKGAKAYFFRRVFHDYSDAVCTDILFNLVPAMSHDSRILIADLMLPENMTPNELPLASFDMTMFNMGGKERTESCFRKILKDAGCELVKVWRSEFGFGVIVEARLKGVGDRVVDGPVEETAITTSEDTTAVCQPPDQSQQNGHINGASDAGEQNGHSTQVAESATPHQPVTATESATPHQPVTATEPLQAQEDSPPLSENTNEEHGQASAPPNPQTSEGVERTELPEQQPQPSLDADQDQPSETQPAETVEVKSEDVSSVTASTIEPASAGGAGLHSTNISATTIQPTSTNDSFDPAKANGIDLPNHSPRPSPGPVDTSDSAADPEAPLGDGADVTKSQLPFSEGADEPATQSHQS